MSEVDAMRKCARLTMVVAGRYGSADVEVRNALRQVLTGIQALIAAAEPTEAGLTALVTVARPKSAVAPVLAAPRVIAPTPRPEPRPKPIQVPVRKPPRERPAAADRPRQRSGRPIGARMNRILDLWAAGLSTAAIAASVGMREPYVLKYLTRARKRGDPRAVRRRGIMMRAAA